MEVDFAEHATFEAPVDGDERDCFSASGDGDDCSTVVGGGMALSAMMADVKDASASTKTRRWPKDDTTNNEAVERRKTRQLLHEKE